jgi:hypothetical protein
MDEESFKESWENRTLTYERILKLDVWNCEGIFLAAAKAKEGAPRSFAVSGFREEDVRAKNAFGRNKKYMRW